MDQEESTHQWLVVQNLEAEDDTGAQIFCSLKDLSSIHGCRIPELTGRRIRGCFHGWVVLCKEPNKLEWCLWNPITSKLIILPCLINKEGDSNKIISCYLSSPPDHSGSILLLGRASKPNFVFCRLDRKRKRLKWTEMSYAKQLKDATGHAGWLRCLTRCKGKVYALAKVGGTRVVCVEIVVKDKEVIISLLPFLECPVPPIFYPNVKYSFLKAYCTELFLVVVSYSSTLHTIDAVYLFKLDMSGDGMMWEETREVGDVVFFMDLCGDSALAVDSELGGYIHIRGRNGRVIYSYHVKDKTIFPSSLHCLGETSFVSMWQVPKFRFEGVHGEGKSCRSKPEDRKKVVKAVESDNLGNDSRLLSVPFHVLEMIMELCVGVEYIKFRATCRPCRLAAPPIQWRGKAARLHNYSLGSPWLMVYDSARGTITFTDPTFGDTYFTRTPPISIFNNVIYYSRYGWLLFCTDFKEMVLFNPFTNDIHKLPQAPIGFQIACFSAPPTSPDCIVIGLTTQSDWYGWILSVGRGTPWRGVALEVVVPRSFIPYFLSPSFCGGNLYAFCNDRKVGVFKHNLSWKRHVDTAPTSHPACNAQYFLAASGEHLFLVIMGEIGESLRGFPAERCYTRMGKD